MTRIIFSRVSFLAFAISLLTVSCRKRADISLPDNLLVFTSSEQGISADENSIEVHLKLSRGTDKDIPVTVNLAGVNATYGTDFTTTPVATNNSITLTIPSGNNETSFTVTKVPGVLFDGDEKVNFSIYSSGAPVLIGNPKTFTLNFAELVATQSSMIMNGGGATYGNKVFVDLSANRQTPVQRTNWDLGFYTAAGSDSFRVVLNASCAMMARQINKNDLNTVTAADTTGFTTDVAYSAFAPSPTQMAYIDYPDGDLSRTAIGLVSATASDNKVYIVNRGTGIGTPAPARGWKKIRIIRNATGGYTLQYADIAATSFSTIDIPKDATYFFKYVSFDNGLVNVEPAKNKWDFAWCYSGYVFNFGGEVPYMFQDFIVQNRNVAVAKVLVATKTYEAFNETSLTDGTITSWSTSQSSIGSDWRATQPAPAANTDRYYIIRDGDGNFYKVRFKGLTDGGVRGFPSFEYALVKHA